ncbi:MAG: EAL domain-containing protein [Sphaerochaeta sp.]|jgi:EAL domain-containing protein (putative c-di-GMP-specific phosphodiesterase class I)|nr:EAL domain-containing protein [Sphaerochaeta sp.]
MKQLLRHCLLYVAICLLLNVLLLVFLPMWYIPAAAVALFCTALGFLTSRLPKQQAWPEKSVKRSLMSNQADVDTLFCLYIAIHAKNVYQSCIDRQELEDVYSRCEQELCRYFGSSNVQRMANEGFAVLKGFPLSYFASEKKKADHQVSVCQNLSERLQALLEHSSTLPIQITIGSASSGMRYHMDTLEQLIDLSYVTEQHAYREHRPWLVADEHVRAWKLDIDECRQGFLNGGWEGEFNPFFQPIVDPDTFTIIGSESLARWQMGGFRILPAQVFKDVAADLQHIATIDTIIITKTFAAIRNMMLARLLPYTFKVVINVSNESLVKGFADQMLFLAKQHGLSSDQVEFDLTDSAFSTLESLSVIQELRTLGFRVSLDIFEDTAFDLQAFERADFDTIKLDFVAFTPLLQEVYISLIATAHKKGVEVIAKGIERKELLDAAIELGCTYVQGNYFTLPIPEQAFEVFMNKYQEGLYVGSLG